MRKIIAGAAALGVILLAIMLEPGYREVVIVVAVSLGFIGALWPPEDRE